MAYKFILSLSLSLILLVGYRSPQEKDFTLLNLWFDAKWQPKDPLLQLLHQLGMGDEKTLESINVWAQKHLLRQNERFHEQSLCFETLKEELYPFFRDLGFISEVTPSFNQYEGAIVHGATLKTVGLRLNYLIAQWKQGVRFNKLYFLSSARPLDPRYEETIEFSETECEMIQRVWEQARVPQEMREDVDVFFINVPMKIDPLSDRSIRPTTNDTVESWLEIEPPKGRYLAVSNAPYIIRQDLVMRTVAPSGYQIDTIGPALSYQKAFVAILLDELARAIFQTIEFRRKHPELVVELF